MQVIIDLHAADCGVHHTSPEAKKKWDIYQLYQLLIKLREDGYKIHSLYGNFIFDNRHREVIDVGKPGEEVEPSLEAAIGIHESGGKLAIVFTDEKYVVFANSYFVAIHFCHMRKARAISVTKALKRFYKLFHKPLKSTLHVTYMRQFEEYYGMDAKPVSCFINDQNIHRYGYAVSVPALKEEDERYDQ